MRVTRTSQSTKRDAPPALEGVRDFVSSLDAGATRPQRFLEIIRSHWGIENKNHWKRDAQWGEDSPRQRNRHSAQVLAILRGALLALIDEPCPQLFARCRRRPSCALRKISSPLPAK